MVEQIKRRPRSKTKKRFYALVTLPDNFDKTLEAIALDELCRAQRAWGVRLTQDEEAHVLESAHRQLERKVLSAMGAEWRLGQRDLSVLIRGDEFDTTCHLPIEKDSDYIDVMVVRKRNFWEITHEKTESTTYLNDMPKQIEGLLKDFMKTGVFYGVGSYK